VPGHTRRGRGDARPARRGRRLLPLRRHARAAQEPRPAWLALRAEHPDAARPLLLAGPAGWKHAALERRLAALAPAGVRRLGRLPLDELRAVVRAATAFVYPSLYEGFGLPVAEAMAAGVPVVVSDRSSLPEVAGEAGLAVDADDAEGLADALAKLVREPELAAELGRRGVARARRFGWDDAADRLAAVFRAALAADGSRR
jgi:alpha-1,3-rhamnosyl/mannosyltransferase